MFPLITYFSHDSVDESFAQALASTGGRGLYSRKDRQGKPWAIRTNSRGKSDEGVLHSHEDWTGVVGRTPGPGSGISDAAEYVPGM